VIGITRITLKGIRLEIWLVQPIVELRINGNTYLYWCWFALPTNRVSSFKVSLYWCGMSACLGWTARLYRGGNIFRLLVFFIPSYVGGKYYIWGIDKMVELTSSPNKAAVYGGVMLLFRENE
jgi:hypothetical protein